MDQNGFRRDEEDPDFDLELDISEDAGPDEAAAYSNIFDDNGGEPKSAEAAGPYAGFGAFPKVHKHFEDIPHKGFDDPDYYKKAVSDEGDKTKRVHGILQKWLTEKDPKNRGVFRQQFIPVFWDFLSGAARKATGDIGNPKKFLLRFGLMNPAMLKPEHKEQFAKIIVNNSFDQPVYYLDEWFKAVGRGDVHCSSTDEVKIARTNAGAKLKRQLEKAESEMEGAKNFIKARNADRSKQEKHLKDAFHSITEHVPSKEFPEYSACYNDRQKFYFGEMQDIIKELLGTDKELDKLYRDYYEAKDDVKTLLNRIKMEGGTEEVDTGAVDTEFGTVRQMVKMTIGRQGNHFPLLTSEYFRSMPNSIGTRENILSLLSWVESIDPEAFCRVHKSKMNRIVPYIVMIPSYGDFGVCWEPFDRHNRSTSRGRIALPMYPKNLQMAVLSAVADLRWQVAKEKASFYWMEEGITGYFYQWFNKNKLKGDLKDTFIKAYILWMTKESEGTMKLDKELRGTFWRYMPFSQPVKERLKTRSFTYQELYQRDVNRSMSDGY